MASRRLAACRVYLLALLGLTGVLASAAPAAADNAAASFFHLQNYTITRCLGISHGVHDGPAILAGCVDHNDQEWTTGKPDGAGYYRIYNKWAQCLGVSAAKHVTARRSLPRNACLTTMISIGR